MDSHVVVPASAVSRAYRRGQRIAFVGMVAVLLALELWHYLNPTIIERTIWPTVRQFNEQVLRDAGRDLCRSHGGYAGIYRRSERQRYYFFQCNWWTRVEGRIFLRDEEAK